MTARKVLVVDDEVHIVHVVAVKLRNNGFEVITAQNGGDALEQARQEQPDCIVTDFQMPVMSGLELVRRLRQQPSTSHIPVIMLTARGFDIPQEQQSQLNITRCLSKPFSPRELLACVEEALGAQVG